MTATRHACFEATSARLVTGWINEHGATAIAVAP